MTSEHVTKADLSREVAELRTATKADLAREIVAIKAELAALRAETKGLIKDLQIKLFAFLGGLQVASITILYFTLDYVGK